ncbi:hypothetical protein MLD38_032753 [Melastoma candidum]|uniref:Uncharacterized protein n=1 Tax=Melastoma candidum TaxID=119954 RepID=A0ACB9M6U4_9MYRT|nr:hypothetical protein MLD38_032753 [Melastoma candidum]
MPRSRSKMEDDSQLIALKKAYADMILNTEKEAAARVMASERKASKYENELVVVKEEAVRLLLRLKHISDAKISETETILRTQQKKIEALETQLEAAEKEVKELQEEIKEMRNLPANRCCQLHKECATCLHSKPRDLVAGSRVSTSRNGEYASSTSRNESGISGTNICHNSTCCGSHHSSTADKAENYGYSTYCKSESEGFRDANSPTFDSRGLRLMESNSNSHKVQDCGRNLRCSDSSKCDSVQEGKVRNDTDTQYLLDDIPDKARRICDDVTGSIGASAMKKKRSLRHRKQTTALFSEMGGLDVKDDHACRVSRPNIGMNQPVTVLPIRATSHGKLINGLVDAADNGEAFAGEDTKQEYKGDLIHTACGSNTKTNSGWLEIEKQNFTSNGVPNTNLDDKFLKYTFQRKHKRDPLLGIDRESIHGLPSKLKPSASLDEMNGTTLSDESQDKEQLIHVAQQLLSFSEKILVKYAGPTN